MFRETERLKKTQCLHSLYLEHFPCLCVEERGGFSPATLSYVSPSATEGVQKGKYCQIELRLIVDVVTTGVA